MIKRFFIYISTLLAFTACSDEEFTIPGNVGPDGELSLMLNVADMSSVNTRSADPDKVSSLTILVLDNAEKVKQIVSYTGSSTPVFSDGKTTITFKLDNDIRSNSNLKFAAIANPPASISMTKDEYYATIINEVFDFNPSTASTVSMSGMKTLSELLGGASIPLFRNVAKVSAMTATRNADNTYTEGTGYSSRVYGTSGQAVLGGTPQNGEFKLAGEDDDLIAGGELVNPTSTAGDRPYVIVKAPFGEPAKDYYYRVNFEKVEGEGASAKIVPLAIEANHEYKIYVLGVKSKGYDNPKEAAQNPASLLETDIIDVCPNSYNMVTDGIRELGVSDKIDFSKAEPTESGNDWSRTLPFYVKVYSPIDGEESAFTVDNISFDVDWLRLEDSDIETSSETGGPSVTGADKFKGTVYRVNLHLNKTIEPGTLETNVNVNWQGLTRSVKVVFTRKFNAIDMIESAKLEMYEGSTLKVTVPEYFNFLDESSATSATYASGGNKTVRLYGVGTGETGDSIRNEGLHFPVMYGESSNRWKYKYTLTYKAPVETAYEYEFLTPGITGVTVNPKSGSMAKDAKVTVTVECSNTDYLYQVGALRFRVTAKKDDGTAMKPVNLDLDLYHTGFFHEEYTKYRQEDTGMEKDKSVSGETEYLYYEVLKEAETYTLGGSLIETYWLDRNLGARMNRMYLETNPPGIYYAPLDANGNQMKEAGGYRHGAQYGTKSGEKYNPATEYKSNLCPPGWEIPSRPVWAKLRSSANLRTSQVGTYFDASMLMDGNRRMYFPKYGYYTGTTRLGNSRSGYYWTRTPADGLEKEHISYYMQMMVFEGTSPGFERVKVDASSTNLDGASMAVRCVYKNATRDDKEDDANRTYFNVSGATHVYLYTQDADGNRTAATQWPGQFIGNYQNMQFYYDNPLYDPVFYLDYASTTASADDLYVIFNYTDANGQIHTISRRTPYGQSDSSARHTIGTNPTSLNGWKVTGDNIGGNTTALGGYWHLAYKGNNAKIIYESTARIGSKYKIQFRKDMSGNSMGNNNYSIYVQYADGTYVNVDYFREGKASRSLDWNTDNSKPIYTFPIAPLGKPMVISISDNDSHSSPKYYNKIVTLGDFSKQSDGSYLLDITNIYNFQTSAPNGAVEPMNVYVYDFAKWGSVNIKASLSNGSVEDISPSSSSNTNGDGYTAYTFQIPNTATNIQIYNPSNLSQNIDILAPKEEDIYFNHDPSNNKPPTGRSRVVIYDEDIYYGHTGVCALNTTEGVPNTPTIHYWGKSQTTWPGVKLNRVGTSRIYWYDFNGTSFIINNGLKETDYWIGNWNAKTVAKGRQKRQTGDKSYSDDFIPGEFFKVTAEKVENSRL